MPSKNRKTPQKPLSKKLKNRPPAPESVIPPTAFPSDQEIDRLGQMGMPPQLVAMLKEANAEAMAGNPQRLTELLEMMHGSPNGETQDERADDAPDDWRIAETEPTSVFPLTAPDVAETIWNCMQGNPSDADLLAVNKHAIDKDAHSIDALVWLGDRESSAQEALAYYQRASAAAPHHDAILISELMPICRRHMAARLIAEAMFTDAWEILRPALAEDPSDKRCVRFHLASLALRLQWHDELNELFNQYKSDDSVAFAFARAISSFQTDGPSDVAENLLRIAHQKSPSVSQLLVSGGGQPGGDEDYGATVFSPNNELLPETIADWFLPGVLEKPGTIKWIRDTVSVKNPLFSEVPKPGIDRTGPGPVEDNLSSLLAIKQTDTFWSLITLKEKGLFYSVVLAQHGPLAIECFEKKPRTKLLVGLVLRAIRSPMMGAATRPSLLAVGTKLDLKALDSIAILLDIELEQTKFPAAMKSELKSVIPKMLEAVLAIDEPTESDGFKFSGDLSQLDELPLVDEAWVVSSIQPPIWVNDEASPWRPYMAQFVNVDDGMIIGSYSARVLPTAADICSAFYQAITAPLAGRPRRPTLLLIDADIPLSDISLHGEQTQLQIAEPRLREEVTNMISAMVEHVNDCPEAIRKQANVAPQQMHHLYDAAARFYKRAPWKVCGVDKLLRVTCTDGEQPGNDWGVCVVGQLGQTLGMSLMPNADGVRQMILEQKHFDYEQAIGLHFDEDFTISPADLWDLERYQWPVAGPEGYPEIFKLNRNKEMEPMNEADIALLTSLLEEVPAFLEQSQDCNHTFTDATGNEYSLTWELF